MKLWARLGSGLVAGLLVGAFGTTAHRTIWGGVGAIGPLPLGFVVAVALAASAGLLVRALAGFGAYALYVLGWVVAVQILAMPSAGGDVLIINPQADIAFAPLGVIWSYGGAAMLVVGALLPGRWFARREIPELEGGGAELAPPVSPTWESLEV